MVAHARLGGGQRRVRVQVVVGAQNLGEVAVDDHGAVHLAELEEAVGGERDVELEAVVTRGEDVLRVAHADEGAQVARQDHVQGRAQRRPRRGLPDRVVEALLVLGCWVELGDVHVRPSLSAVDYEYSAGQRPGRGQCPPRVLAALFAASCLSAGYCPRTGRGRATPPRSAGRRHRQPRARARGASREGRASPWSRGDVARESRRPRARRRARRPSRPRG